MAQQEISSLVFYLCLSEKLPPSYFALSYGLKKEGVVVVPVRFDQLQKVISASEQGEVTVVSSVRTIAEAVLYQKTIRKHLKYLLKSKRISFVLLSSFSKLSDQKNFLSHKNYFFLKYPLELTHLCLLISRFLDLKKEKSQRWPGGKRSNAGVSV